MAQETNKYLVAAIPTSYSHSYNHDLLQWIIEQYDDNQWTVRSVRGQKYLGFETSAPQDGAPLVGLNRPRLWDIEFLPDSEDHDHPRVKYVLSYT